tara:strand:- start:513 stop:980 length:468 start_codon:yes stop_codon:yes gene_type:complete
MSFKLPRPKIGDTLERQNLDGQIEEAMVISLKYNKEDPTFWHSVLITRNGFEFVSSHANPITHTDWRPKGWVYHRVTNSFLPVGASPVAGSDEVIFEAGTEPEKLEELPLPPPVAGEKYMSWRARAYKAVPDLRGNPSAPELLSLTWKKREQVSF